MVRIAGGGELSRVYAGQCFCGAIRFELRDSPLIQGYCHCQDCRDWSGAPLIAFMLVPYDAFRIVEGEEHLLLYARTPETPRGCCARCGGGVGAFRKNAEQPHVGTSPYFFDGFPFEPTMHVFCDESVLAVFDELPHYRTIPEALGGSGELVTGSAKP
jgi:hypothetical protein